MNLRNTIIYLIGIPAVGKYMVAKEIGRMTGAKVVDNQLINFPVYSVIGYDGTANNSADRSNGYEAVSREFISCWRSDVGAATVRGWAKDLPPGGAVLDLGCGHGAPISQALVDEGLNVYGIDASPSMIAAFRARFPHAPAECSAVEDSQFFGHMFDGVIAWGLVFLLPPDAQANLIHKAAAALKPGGRFVFTAPHQVCEWPDNLTGRKSVSLGSDAYRQIVRAAGLLLYDEAEDEGQNHYYFVRKPDSSEG
jgi:SAM-dependent methyltransferase